MKARCLPMTKDYQTMVLGQFISNLNQTSIPGCDTLILKGKEMFNFQQFIVRQRELTRQIKDLSSSENLVEQVD